MRGLGIVLVAVVQLPSSAQLPVPKPAYTAFQRAERVTIANYSGDAMKPFLTRDGRFLLFNNLNDPRVNTSALEAVPSVSCSGELYFVSTRSYQETFSTIYRARFSEGVATGIQLVPGISRRMPSWVNAG